MAATTNVLTLCPCGKDHRDELEKTPEGRTKLELLARFSPTTLRHVPGAAFDYVVPRIYIAAHRVKARDLPALAAKYKWARKTRPRGP